MTTYVCNQVNTHVASLPTIVGNIMKTLGDRVREVREERGLSQDQLTAMVRKAGAKLADSAIGQLELRSSRSSRSSREIAIALGVNHDWLLTGKGPKELLKSIDRKLQLLPQDDFDDLYDDFTAIIEKRMEKRNIR